MERKIIVCFCLALLAGCQKTQKTKELESKEPTNVVAGQSVLYDTLSFRKLWFPLTNSSLFKIEGEDALFPRKMGVGKRWYINECLYTNSTRDEAFIVAKFINDSDWDAYYYSKDSDSLYRYWVAKNSIPTVSRSSFDTYEIYEFSSDLNTNGKFIKWLNYIKIDNLSSVPRHTSILQDVDEKGVPLDTIISLESVNNSVFLKLQSVKTGKIVKRTL